MAAKREPQRIVAYLGGLVGRAYELTAPTIVVGTTVASPSQVIHRLIRYAGLPPYGVQLSELVRYEHW